jgi:hypothetical protein
MAFGLYEDRHHNRVQADRLAEARPGLDVCMLLRSGALAEGTTTQIQSGEMRYYITYYPIYWSMETPYRLSGMSRCAVLLGHGSGVRCAAADVVMFT